MIKDYVKQIYELDMGFASREEIMNEYIDNFKKSFVGTYDELQAKMKEVREEAKQEFHRRKDEMLDYIFDNSSVRKLPNGRKVFDKLWENAWRDEHSYGYEAVYNDFEDKEADFLEMYELTQEK